jgi:hypothetical protein
MSENPEIDEETLDFFTEILEAQDDGEIDPLSWKGLAHMNYPWLMNVDFYEGLYTDSWIIVYKNKIKDTEAWIFELVESTENSISEINILRHENNTVDIACLRKLNDFWIGYHTGCIDRNNRVIDELYDEISSLEALITELQEYQQSVPKTTVKPID